MSPLKASLSLGVSRWIQSRATSTSVPSMQTSIQKCFRYKSFRMLPAIYFLPRICAIVSTHPSICCDHSQMPGFVIRMCHCRPLWPCWNGLCSTRVRSLSGLYLAVFDPKSTMVSVSSLSTHPSICCDHSQMPGFVIRMCHCRPLWPCWNGLCSTRVRSLSGLYLAVFDPKSTMVSVSSLKEVNRLREAYREDLPLYEMPPKPLSASLPVVLNTMSQKPKRAGLEVVLLSLKPRKAFLPTPEK